jgi:DNA-binding CsgD family transcriptional regulator
VRFTHPLFSSAIYARASTETRKRLHRRLATLVTDPEEQARHLALSSDPPESEVANTLELAARRAASRGAPDAAALLLEHAVDFTPPSSEDEVLRRRLDAADQHVASGDLTRARLLFDGVTATVVTGPIRARALHRCARVSALSGEFLAVPQLLREALAEVADDDPLRASIERDLVWSLAQVGAVTELLPHAEAALRAAETANQPVLVAEALDHLCMAQFFAGDGVDPDLLERAIRLDRQVGMAPLVDHPGISGGRLTLALTLKWTDNFDDARTLLDAMQAEHLNHGDESALMAVLFHLGELECWAGNWVATTSIATTCRELAMRSDQTLAKLRGMTLEAMVACYRGDADAVTRGIVCLELAEETGDWPAIIRTLKALGVHELSVGNAEAAVDHLARGLAVEATFSYDDATVRIVPDAVEALIAVGRHDEASPLVEELERDASRRGRPWALAVAARCRGLCEAAAGRLVEAQDALKTAVHEHAGLPQPFELARTLLSLGAVQRRSRQQRAAREALGEARDLFDALGASRWADRTRTELGRIGGRAADRYTLTPTEEQVADLVATGQTNNEIAASLFISAKTVEANLTRIYRKLGVSSRRELARRIRGVRQPGA